MVMSFIRLRSRCSVGSDGRRRLIRESHGRLVRCEEAASLLLGNGFSIALKPGIFSYGSLYENADFSAAPHVKKLFDALGAHFVWQCRRRTGPLPHPPN